MTIREFETEFKRLYLPLGMYALRLVGDTVMAEDMVQDAFAAVWQALSEGTEIDSFRPYMYRCVHNACLVYLRQKQDMVGADMLPEVANEDIDTSERDANVWRAIDALPARCREVFLMSKRDGMSNQEIADELGLSVKTVKNQMTKAFSRLHDALAPGHKPFFLPFL